MAFTLPMNSCFHLFLWISLLSAAGIFIHLSSALNRQSFPEGFIFGAASSAYQYEGAWNEDGKGPSIWDTFTSKYPEKIADHANGMVADDFYHLYEEDIKLMKDVGIDAFRLSISWPRLLPHGKISKGVNHKGIQAYNNLINDLLANGIKPVVTLFHWDLPQALEDDYGGFLSPKILDDFQDYVDLCFNEFGDRVKYWITVNEANLFSEFGYALGEYAPGRCSSYIGNCSAGNSATEPYLVAHHLLLSHALAVKLYKQHYQDSQSGMIGITVSCFWMVPYNQTSYNLAAASRAFDFGSGWILDPINFGKYPETMRTLVGSRLPEFTPEQSNMLKHSFDFLGLNYYTSYYAKDDNSSNPTELSYTTDSRTATEEEKDGIPIGEPTPVSWIYIYPEGLRYLLNYVKEKYNNPLVIITENGMADWNNYTLPLEDFLHDHQKIHYHRLHLSYLHKTIKNNGANVKGYFVWSFLDDFEWAAGYTNRFGIHFVDYKNGLSRFPKDSAFWFKKFLKRDNQSKLISSMR